MASHASRAMLAADQARECGKAWRLWAETGDRPDIQAVIAGVIREHLAHAQRHRIAAGARRTDMAMYARLRAGDHIRNVRHELADIIPYEEEI